MYLSENYLGHYSNSAWNSYISSSGEFLFKKDDNNQISFGNNAFTLKVSDSATISGSNINLITPKFFLGGTNQYISGSNGKIEISSSNFYLDANGNLSLKDKLSWDVTTLNINGRIEVSNGSFVPGSSIYQHGPLTHWPRSKGTPPNDLLPNASWVAVAENAIEYVMGPYGTQELAITCDPADGEGDGGFDSHFFPIDSGSAYMFVAYIKRKTSSTAGYAWFGVNGYNASGTNVGLVTNAPALTLNSNPYFLVGNMTPAGETEADSVDRWLLHIGYVYPSGSAYDAARKSVVYDLTTGLTGSYNIQNEIYIWNTGTTQATIRSYHFYNNSGNAGVLKYQEIARPGVFKMDGSEPTIQSLLSNTSTGGSTKIDGASITTGKIRSNNFSTTLGSELDLNTGTFKLGGSTSPKLSWNGTTLSLTGDINITSGTGFATPASVTASISAATSSLSSSFSSSLSAVSSSAASSITTVSASLITVSSSFSSSLSTVSSSAASSITSAVNRIVTDANNKITKPQDTPSAGAGLYLASNYLGYYSNSAWNSYISSSGEFLFKKDDNNQISFGNNAFTLKVSDSATISGSNINLITPKFFLGGTSQYISGSNGKIEISSSNFQLSSDGNVTMAGNVNANTGIFKKVNIIGTIAKSNNGLKYFLEPWITGSAAIGQTLTGNIVKLLTNGTGGTAGATPYKFKLGTYTWNGRAYGLLSNIIDSTAAKTSLVSAPYFAKVTGSSFNTAADNISNDIFDTTAAVVGIGQPFTFDNWGFLAGYNTGEYGKNAQGNFITGSIDTTIFDVPNSNNYPIQLTIKTDNIYLDNIDPLTTDIPDSLNLQIQSKFICRDSNSGLWLYAFDSNGNPSTYKAYDCNFTIEIFNGNNQLLLTDSRIQQFENEWIDFNIPITSILLKNPSFAYNYIQVALSWHVIKHPIPINHTVSSPPQQIRLTELRIVRLPTSIGLSTSTIKFSDSYLSSMNNGTAVHGDLIPVDDALYDLGSANQNPVESSYSSISPGAIRATSIPTKRWNHIYGKFISADSAVSVGNSVVLQETSSVAHGNSTITSGIHSHTEGVSTRTGKFREVYNTTLQTDLDDIIYARYPQLPDNVWSGIDLSEYCYIAIGGYQNDVALNVANIQTIDTNDGDRITLLDKIQCADSFVYNVTLTGGSLSGQYRGPSTPLTSASFTLYAFKYPINNQTYNRYINEFSQINARNGYGSHAEGYATVSYGFASHAEGDNTVTQGTSSHAEGKSSVAGGPWSHAEGHAGQSIGHFSHAEGTFTKAQGSGSHSEGEKTVAYGNHSHAEGSRTTALGEWSHAEGNATQAYGDGSHTEGRNTIAQGLYSHAEGVATIASGAYSHAEGALTQALGNWSHAEGYGTKAYGDYSHAEGNATLASGAGSHVSGLGCQTGFGLGYSASISLGVITLENIYQTDPVGDLAYSFWNNTSGIPVNSFFVLILNKPEGSSGWIPDDGIGLQISNAYYNGTQTIIQLANTTWPSATGVRIQAIVGQLAAGQASWLNKNFAGPYKWSGNQLYTGVYATNNKTGRYSHANGWWTTAIGNYSHAEGFNSMVSANYAYAAGNSTIASGDYQHVVGEYNSATNTGAGAFIVGNGTGPTTKSNLIFASGSKVEINGKLAIGTTSVHASAQVQIDSTTKGVILPRMTTAQINAIASPAHGLTIFNTTINTLCVRSGTGIWLRLNTSNM